MTYNNVLKKKMRPLLNSSIEIFVQQNIIRASSTEEINFIQNTARSIIKFLKNNDFQMIEEKHEGIENGFILTTKDNQVKFIKLGEANVNSKATSTSNLEEKLYMQQINELIKPISANTNLQIEDEIIFFTSEAIPNAIPLGRDTGNNSQENEATNKTINDIINPQQITKETLTQKELRETMLRDCMKIQMTATAIGIHDVKGSNIVCNSKTGQCHLIDYMPFNDKDIKTNAPEFERVVNYENFEQQINQDNSPMKQIFSTLCETLNESGIKELFEEEKIKVRMELTDDKIKQICKEREEIIQRNRIIRIIERNETTIPAELLEYQQKQLKELKQKQELKREEINQKEKENVTPDNELDKSLFIQQIPALENHVLRERVQTANVQSNYQLQSQTTNLTFDQ